MKRFLALVLVGAMVFSLPVFAAESPSAAATAKQNGNTSQPKNTANASTTNTTPAGNTATTISTVPGFAEQVPTTLGGDIVIDGKATNYEIELVTPTLADANLGKNIAATFEGSKLLSIVGMKSADLTDFKSAKVNFKLEGVNKNTKLLCYMLVNGELVPVRIRSIKKDHVVLDMKAIGELFFIELPNATKAPAADTTTPAATDAAPAADATTPVANDAAPATTR